jgi:hypothetical protein
MVRVLIDFLFFLPVFVLVWLQIQRMKDFDRLLERVVGMLMLVIDIELNVFSLIQRSVVIAFNTVYKRRERQSTVPEEGTVGNRTITLTLERIFEASPTGFPEPPT